MRGPADPGGCRRDFGRESSSYTYRRLAAVSALTGLRRGILPPLRNYMHMPARQRPPGQALPSGDSLSAGHSALLPLQDSVGSQLLVDERQTVPAGCRSSGEQAGLAPVQ